MSRQEERTKKRKVLEDFRRYICESIKAIAPDKITEEQAEAIADKATDLCSSNYGGELIYIPKDTAYLKQQLHRQILREFNGKNQRELARKYSLSMQAVYRIIKAQIQRTQYQLFLSVDFEGEE